MSGYIGSSLVVTWIQSAATTVLTGDHKSLSLTPTIALVDETAGADAYKKYLPGVKDYTATFNANFQAGAGTGGTATFSTVAMGEVGTLEIQPEGTASPKQNLKLPAIAQGPAYSWPYDNLGEITVNFQGNGAIVEAANS